MAGVQRFRVQREYGWVLEELRRTMQVGRAQHFRAQRKVWGADGPLDCPKCACHRTNTTNALLLLPTLLHTNFNATQMPKGG